MREYDAQWPQFSFSAHKGYGTSSHMQLIKQHGACPIHRFTFAPLKTMYPERAAAAKQGALPMAAAAAPEPSKAPNSKGNKRVSKQNAAAARK
jgi:hypothetical protein